ncbi:uncharacterized protein DC041_0007544, partial [Schistosoma bovis]
MSIPRIRDTNESDGAAHIRVYSDLQSKNFPHCQLTECLTAPLVDRLEEWKRSVAQLDRENGKEWRRAKSELQRATCELEKLSKRSRRK